MAKTDTEIPGIDEGPAESAIEWVKSNSKGISIGGIVVVAVAAVGLLWRASVEKKETRASEALAAAQMVVLSGNAALAQSDLQALLRRYDGTTAAIQARMLLAQVYFGQNEVDKGLAELDAIGSGGPYAASVQGLRGAGLEQAGKPAEAAAAFERAAEAAATIVARSNFRADAARAHQAAGNTDAARGIWEAMATDDDNPLAGEARVRLGELTAKPIG